MVDQAQNQIDIIINSIFNSQGVKDATGQFSKLQAAANKSSNMLRSTSLVKQIQSQSKAFDEQKTKLEAIGYSLNENGQILTKSGKVMVRQDHFQKLTKRLTAYDKEQAQAIKQSKAFEKQQQQVFNLQREQAAEKIYQDMQAPEEQARQAGKAIAANMAERVKQQKLIEQKAKATKKATDMNIKNQEREQAEISKLTNKLSYWKQSSVDAARIGGNAFQQFGNRLKIFGSQFQMANLSMLFFGMAIKRIASTILTSTVSTFLSIVDSSNRAAQGIAMITAGFNVLKFAVGEAIANALLPYIPTIMRVIDFILDLVDKFGKWIPLVIFGTFALGLLLETVGQLSLGMAGVLFFVGRLITILGGLSAPVIIIIALLVLFAAGLWTAFVEYPDTAKAHWTGFTDAVKASFSGILDSLKNLGDLTLKTFFDMDGTTEDYIATTLWLVDVLALLVISFGLVVVAIVDLIGFFVHLVKMIYLAGKAMTAFLTKDYTIGDVGKQMNDEIDNFAKFVDKNNKNLNSLLEKGIDLGGKVGAGPQPILQELAVEQQISYAEAIEGGDLATQLALIQQASTDNRPTIKAGENYGKALTEGIKKGTEKFNFWGSVLNKANAEEQGKGINDFIQQTQKGFTESGGVQIPVSFTEQGTETTGTEVANELNKINTAVEQNKLLRSQTILPLLTSTEVNDITSMNAQLPILNTNITNMDGQPVVDTGIAYNKLGEAMNNVFTTQLQKTITDFSDVTLTNLNTTLNNIIETVMGEDGLITSLNLWQQVMTQVALLIEESFAPAVDKASSSLNTNASAARGAAAAINAYHSALD